MKPLYERILVKPRKKETTTASGIVLPTKAVKRPNIGTVVAHGAGSKHNPMLVKKDDLVIFNRYAGMELMVKGELHYVVLSNEIIAVLESEDEISLDEFD